MVYIEIPKEFDKGVIDVVAKKLQLAPSYIEWLLSVGNKEALKKYNAAQQQNAVDRLRADGASDEVASAGGN